MNHRWTSKRTQNKKGNLIYNKLKERPRTSILVSKPIDYLPIPFCINSDGTAVVVQLPSSTTAKVAIIASANYLRQRDTIANSVKELKLNIVNCATYSWLRCERA